MASAPGSADLFRYEREAFDNGVRCVAGVDEVGRGPLAGPVVAAAVILPETGWPEDLTDSKALTPERRETLAAELRALPGIRIGCASAPAKEIDRLDILRCTHQTMARALRALDPPAEFALIDGLPVPGLPVPFRAVVKGDALSASIAAASILAKVRRDALMVRLDELYPGYGFARHKGYGTAEHLDCLRRLGPCPVHRKTFGPVAHILNGGWTQMEFDWENPPAGSG